MKYDHLENLWYCEECGLDLERVEKIPNVAVMDSNDNILVKQVAWIRTDNVPDKPISVILEWSLNDFSFHVDIGDEAKRMLKQQIGMLQSVLGSKYWGALK